MKRTTLLVIIVLVFGLALAACKEEETPDTNPGELTLIDGDEEHTYTRETLEALPQTIISDKGTDYVGVQMPALLTDAGLDLADLSAVKVVATDGYSVNYDTDMLARDDVILAYATADGDLSSDEGDFRMVLPGEEGKLNVRMAAEVRTVR